MLERDTFVVRTILDQFIVRVKRVPRSLGAQERAQASRLFGVLRAGVEGNDPEGIETAEQLLAAASGETSFAPRALGASTADANFARSLLSELEQAFASGRLTVERVVVKRPPNRRPVEAPRPRPQSPAARDAALHSFELRLVDEIGRAIGGVDADFVADGPHTVSANAAGAALLDGMKTSSATASLNDPDALSKVLEQRWDKPRPGAPPKTSNVQEAFFRQKALGPFPLKAEVPNTLVIKPPLGKLFVELFDKTGRVRHANRTFQISGPQAFQGTTDGSGQLLQADVFPGDYSLSLALDFFEENDPDRAMDIADTQLVVLDPNEAQPLVRQIAAVPRSVLARLRMHFNTNKSFLLPTALPSVKKLRQIYTNNAPCKLLVVGHADTRGNASYNDKLSLERAEATIAFLKDDVESWFKFYGQGIETQKRWGKVEDKLMISALPDFVHKPFHESGMAWFQRTRKLSGGGSPNDATRRALITEYMALDGTSLTDFVGEISATAHGCGENFPLDDSGKELDTAPADEKRDAIDRRVELFFFDPEFGITPPPPGPNSKPASREYPLWRKRVVETVELSPEDRAGPKVQFVELADAHFRTDSAVVLPEGENPDDQGNHGAFSAAGFIATVLRVNQEQPGRSLLVAGHTDTSAGDAHNDELSRLRAKLTLALLVGDRASFQSLAKQRNKPADVNQIMSWVSKAFKDLSFDCDPGKISDVVDASVVRRFQSGFNTNKPALGSSAADLTVDGAVGEQTWGAFFDCYELDLQRELGENTTGVADLRSSLLFADDDRKSLGFGERFPIEELGVDNFRSQTNRRVEVLFFNPGEEPDLAQAEADPETSEVYLPGFYAREAVPPRKTARVTAISILVASFQWFRLTQAPFTIETDAGVTIKGQTDSKGAVAAKMPADTGSFVLTVQDPTPLPDFQVLFRNAYRLGSLAPAASPLGAIQRLRMLSLWTGPALSAFTEGTTDALSYFQLLVDLPQTGVLDGATAAMLDQMAFEAQGAAS